MRVDILLCSLKKIREKGGIGIKKNRLKGSITVEATLVLPVFTFVVITFLSFIQFLIIQEKIQHSLTQVAREASKNAYIYEQLKQSPNEKENKVAAEQGNKESTIINEIASGFVFEQEFEKFNTLSKNEESRIAGGIKKINFYKSSFMKKEEIIEVVATYKFELPIKTFFLATLPVEQRVKTRGFVGKTCISAGENKLGGVKEEEDDYVYITKNGAVYHKNKECSHLKRTIIRCTYEELSTKRNKYGGRYYPCERCMDSISNQQPYYYITPDGNNYHATLDCPSLKRSIRMVKKSTVMDRLPCSKCCD